MSEIRPIDPAANDTPPKDRPVLALSSMLVMGLCALMGLVALGMSLYFFLGFAENDIKPGVLFSAFALCFGVGALGYVPMFWIALIARRVRKKGPATSDIILVLALIIPWVMLAIVLTATGRPLLIYGVIIGALSTFILTWAWAMFREK